MSDLIKIKGALFAASCLAPLTRWGCNAEINLSTEIVSFIFPDLPASVLHMALGEAPKEFSIHLAYGAEAYRGRVTKAGASAVFEEYPGGSGVSMYLLELNKYEGAYTTQFIKPRNPDLEIGEQAPPPPEIPTFLFKSVAELKVKHRNCVGACVHGMLTKVVVEGIKQPLYFRSGLVGACGCKDGRTPETPVTWTKDLIEEFSKLERKEELSSVVVTFKDLDDLRHHVVSRFERLGIYAPGSRAKETTYRVHVESLGMVRFFNRLHGTSEACGTSAASCVSTVERLAAVFVQGRPNTPEDPITSSDHELCPRENCGTAFLRNTACPKCGYPGFKSVATCNHLELYEIRLGSSAGKLGCLAPGCKALFDIRGRPIFAFSGGHVSSWNVVTISSKNQSSVFHAPVERITKGPTCYREPWTELRGDKDTVVHEEFTPKWYGPDCYVVFMKGGAQGLVKVKEV